MQPIIIENQKCRGRPPLHDATLQVDGVLYLPRMTYLHKFEPAAWVRLSWDTGRSLLVITFGPRTPYSTRIVFHSRNYSIRCQSLLRQVGVTVTKPISGALVREGNSLTLRIPKRSVKTV